MQKRQAFPSSLCLLRVKMCAPYRSHHSTTQPPTWLLPQAHAWMPKYNLLVDSEQGEACWSYPQTKPNDSQQNIYKRQSIKVSGMWETKLREETVMASQLAKEICAVCFAQWKKKLFYVQLPSSCDVNWLISWHHTTCVHLHWQKLCPIKKLSLYSLISLPEKTANTQWS